MTSSPRFALRPRTICSVALLSGVLACGSRGGLDGIDPGDATVDAGSLDAAASLDAGRLDTGPPDAGPESDIGEPCDGPEDCLSADQVVDVPACIGPGAEWGNASLWRDGYCAAQCTPSPSPGEGESLARDGCPLDALCVPSGGGVGVCLLACEDDGECRSEAMDYFCRRSFGSSASGEPAPLPVGVCQPSHCRTRACPGSAGCDC